jgi:hypothetical protein
MIALAIAKRHTPETSGATTPSCSLSGSQLAPQTITTVANSASSTAPTAARHG